MNLISFEGRILLPRVENSIEVLLLYSVRVDKNEAAYAIAGGSAIIAALRLDP
jgi:hypothetical protein